MVKVVDKRDAPWVKCGTRTWRDQSPALSVFINGRGANSFATVRWNIYPMPIDSNPSRVWSWRCPQGLAGITPPQPPDPFSKLDAHRVTFGHDARCLGIALYEMELIGPAPTAATGRTPHP